MFLLGTTIALASAVTFSTAELGTATDYLNNICGDTYCGGDLDYTVNQITCDEVNCNIDVNVFSLYEDDSKIISKISTLSLEQRNSTELSVSESLDYGFDEHDEYEYPIFNATCKIPKTNISKIDIEEEFYDVMTGMCAPSIEAFVSELR